MQPGGLVGAAWGGGSWPRHNWHQRSAGLVLHEHRETIPHHASTHCCPLLTSCNIHNATERLSHTTDIRPQYTRCTPPLCMHHSQYANTTRFTHSTSTTHLCGYTHTTYGTYICSLYVVSYIYLCKVLIPYLYLCILHSPYVCTGMYVCHAGR